MWFAWPANKAPFRSGAEQRHALRTTESPIPVWTGMGLGWAWMGLGLIWVNWYLIPIGPRGLVGKLIIYVRPPSI